MNVLDLLRRVYRRLRPEPTPPGWMGWVQSGSWKHNESTMLGGGQADWIGGQADWIEGPFDGFEVRVNGRPVVSGRYSQPCSRIRYIRTGPAK